MPTLTAQLNYLAEYGIVFDMNILKGLDIVFDSKLAPSQSILQTGIYNQTNYVPACRLVIFRLQAVGNYNQNIDKPLAHKSVRLSNTTNLPLQCISQLLSELTARQTNGSVI